MVNNDRIVPIQKTDFLSLIGTVLVLGEYAPTIAAAADGNFVLTGTGDIKNVLCNQPAVSIDFASGVTAGVAYFVADYGFNGFKVAGTAVEPAAGSDDVNPDGITLYAATLSSGDVTVAALTPSAS